MSGSILESVRKVLGGAVEGEYFDDEIIMNVNSAFAVLWQLGVGPQTVFSITGAEETWNDFLPDNPPELNLVKNYVYLAARIEFDPPQSSSVLSTLKERLSEYEWRMRESVEARKE